MRYVGADRTYVEEKTEGERHDDKSAEDTRKKKRRKKITRITAIRKGTRQMNFKETSRSMIESHW
jgi:hypothetical protein